jgi:hypothetical protein
MSSALTILYRGLISQICFLLQKNINLNKAGKSDDSSSLKIKVRKSIAVTVFFCKINNTKASYAAGNAIFLFFFSPTER